MAPSSPSSCPSRQDFNDQPRFTGYLRDLTGLKNMESELRRSRDELEAILEAVADSVSARGPDGDLIYANPAALTAAGMSSIEELRAAVPEELIADLEIVVRTGSQSRPASRLICACSPATMRSRSSSDTATGTRARPGCRPDRAPSATATAAC